MENDYKKIFDDFVDCLKYRKKILFLTTSTRWAENPDHELPKSTQLAHIAKERLGDDRVEIIDVSKLMIVPCEGNVSRAKGNICGCKDAKLLDSKKNPTGQIRCWAAFHNPEDELWKLVNPLFEADCVVFFASVRWGQTNGIYQRLIERLTWLENRHSTLKEENLLKNKLAGFVIVGQNWRAKEIVEIQKGVLEFYGFEIDERLFWYWQFGQDSHAEDEAEYKNAVEKFNKVFYE